MIFMNGIRAMKLDRLFTLAIVLPAAVSLLLGFPSSAIAQTAPPVLTPAQQAYVNTRAACNAAFLAQNLPRSQFYTFRRKCLADNGVKRVPLPHGAEPSNSQTDQQE